jgi:single-strand DNA-binding protein
MNVITVAGNLGKDAELKYLQSGESVLTFSVADSEGRDKGTIWWNCSLWGKRAESLDPFLKKGSQVTVTGRVTERSYTDKNGQERKAMDVRVNDIALQGKPGGSHDEPVRETKRQVSSGGGVTDEDIPFAPIRGALLLAM